MPTAKQLAVLRRRAEFLAVASHGRKWVAPGLIVQMGAPHSEQDKVPIRYGLTASRKVGNAVIRNRARRRMRALANEILPRALPGYDYVLIARAATATRDFQALRQDLTQALKKLGAYREASV